MASYKTAHRRQHRRRSSTRKNVKSRKVARGGGNPNTNKCNANKPQNISDPYSPEVKAWKQRFGLNPTDDVFVACVRKYGK
jgi:hypothetical protein